MSSMNTGYVEWSMSKRAAAAYEDGEMPKSKWTKAAMLAAIAEVLDDNEIELSEEQMENLEKLPREFMFDRYFWASSWHHTSKYCNATDFYSVDEDRVLTDANDSTFEYYIEFTVNLPKHTAKKTFGSKRELTKYMARNGISHKAGLRTFGHGAFWYSVREYVR